MTKLQIDPVTYQVKAGQALLFKDGQDVKCKFSDDTSVVVESLILAFLGYSSVDLPLLALEQECRDYIAESPHVTPVAQKKLSNEQLQEYVITELKKRPEREYVADSMSKMQMTVSNGQTIIRSVPAVNADSVDGNSYFFSWATLGLSGVTILQLLNSKQVSTNVSITWNDNGLTVSGITDANNCKLMYVVPTTFDNIDPVVINVTGVEITGDDTITNVGTLTAVITPDNATDTSVMWQSNDANVASVNAGQVTVVANGSVTIIATSVSNPSVSGTKLIQCILSASGEISDVVVTISAMNNDWQYAKENGTYAVCTLPHSINGEDSATKTYYRGVVNYKKSLTLDTNKKYYLYLDGANLRGNVTLNGIPVGNVVNAYQPAIIDLPIASVVNGSNELVVSLSNASSQSTIPYAGDFNFYNGLDRGVRLIETGRICFDPVLYGTRRCSITADVETKTITAKVNLVNHHVSAQACDVEIYVYPLPSTDAIVPTVMPFTTVESFDSQELIISVPIPDDKFNLWNGRGSANLYKVEIFIKQNGVIKDTIVENTGFRTFSIEKHTTAADGAGFLLNGSAYKLYGTNYHTDKAGKASALTSEDYASDLALIEALKPTMLKFAHYTCDHSLIDYCDEHGIVVMLEIPWSRSFPPSTSSIASEYRANITSAMLSMIKEYGNHPSVIFWCFDNELGYSPTLGYDTDELHTFMTSLYTQAKAIDPQRLVGAGFYVNTSGERGWTDVCDLMLSTHYKGWYSGNVSGSLAEANSDNNQMAMPKAINEYGYGANPAQHISWAEAATHTMTSANSYDTPHYEEYQAYALEKYLSQFETVQWPVFNLQWAMFDFGVATRSEGGTIAINTKGLITRDRSIIKDSYYLYRALWNTDPIVHICQKRWTDRGTTNAALHVYSNGAKVELYRGGALLQTLTAPNGNLSVCWDFTAVDFVDGDNVFEVKSYTNAEDTTSAAIDTWTYLYVSVPEEAVTLIGDDVIVNSGKLRSSVTPVGSSQTVTWSVDNPAIASVDSSTGVITALSDGDAVVTATSAENSTLHASKTVACRKVLESEDELSNAISIAPSSWKTQVELFTRNGVTITSNGDGTITFNGTATAAVDSGGDSYIWKHAYPYHQSGGFPFNGQEGELLVWVEHVSGSVSNFNPSETNFFRISFKDHTGVDDLTLNLAPLCSHKDYGVADNGSIMARKITTTAGIGSVYLRLILPSGATFDNLTYRIRIAKRVPTAYDTGIVSELAVGTGLYTDKCSVRRNLDGSFTLFPFAPDTAYNFTGTLLMYLRLWESFDIAGSKHKTGTPCAPSGSTVKMSIDLLSIPDIKTMNAESEIRWIIRGSDGSVIAALDYVLKGSAAVGDIFASGHAEIETVATSDVLGIEFLVSNVAFKALSNYYDVSKNITFAAKLEMTT